MSDHGFEDDDWAEKTAVTGGTSYVPTPSVASPSNGLLMVLTGPAIGRSYTLENKPVNLGRSEAEGVFIPDPRISRRHARIHWENGEYFLSDLGSTNGTFVDGDRLEAPRKLETGARIQLGSNTLLKFQRMDALEAAVHKRMNDAVFTDALTGVNNRRYMELRLAEEFSFARRHIRPLSVLLLDLDHFKSVNDTYGHQVGDEVLRTIAGLLRRFIRREDVLCRYGGEEFMIIARGITLTQALQFGRRICKVIEATPVPTVKGTLKLTLSVGVATYDRQPDEQIPTLVQRADAALYLAKSNGRNRAEGAQGNTVRAT